MQKGQQSFAALESSGLDDDESNHFASSVLCYIVVAPQILPYL